MPKPVNDVCSPKSTGASRSQPSGLSQAGRGSCDNAIPDESPELHERGVHMSTEAAAVDSAGGPVVKEKKRRKKKLSFPTAFTILFVLTIIAVIATSFVPAGQYAKLQYVADSNVLTVTSPQGEISAPDCPRTAGTHRGYPRARGTCRVSARSRCGRTGCR